jgi:predicted ATP-grasp superfamily ATP-dependent carboligase
MAREEWELAGVRIATASPQTLIRAFDKSETLRLAVEVDVAVPPTRTPESIDEAIGAAQELGFPCVVKSRFSNLWRGDGFYPDHGPGYAADEPELRRLVQIHRQGDHWPIVQGFVEGQGRGVFALYDRGSAVAWFAHERLRDVRPSGSGSSLRKSTRLEPRLKEPAERLLDHMEWHGPAMVEFRDPGHGPPVLMEVNGRFWGSLELARAAGVEFPALWLELAQGVRPTSTPEYRPGVVRRWLWGDFKRVVHVLRGAPRGYPHEYPSRRDVLLEVLGRQPEGTRSETWSLDDPLPAIGEWVQGFRDMVRKRAKGSG